ncbi:MAG: hypothetical protein KBC48_03050 [Candidatus Pacebacteria bacterium]|nr:hypothetical protein [Candidatus Paceibacterota bacterium]
MKYLLAGAFFLLPFVSSKAVLYGTVNAKYFLLIALVVVTGLWGAYQLYRGRLELKVGPKSWLLGATILTLAIFGLAGLLGVYPAGSWWSDIIRSSGLFFLTSLTFLTVLISQLLRPTDFIFIRRAVIASGIVYSLLSIIGVEGLGLLNNFLGVPIMSPGLSLGNSTFGGVFLVLSLILTLVEVVRSTARSRGRKVLILATVLQVLSPILINFKLWTGSEVWLELINRPAAILGSARASSAVVILLAVYLLGYWLVNKILATNNKTITRAYSGLWLLGLAAALVLLFTPGSFIQDEYIKESTAARLIVWESGWEAFKDKPVLGWGPENFRLGFVQHFDNRLMEEQNFAEIWFDRAHNIIVDTLVSVGVVGTVSVLLLISLFILIIIRASRAGLISEPEKIIWLILPVVHFLQLQTGFDTVTSYALLAIILAYALSLERQMVSSSFSFNLNLQRVIAGLFIVLALGGGVLLVQDYRRQTALVKIFKSTDGAEQLRLIDQALSGSASFESLRVATSSMLKGLFASMAQARTPADQAALAKVGLTQLTAYEQHFKSYLERQPDDYRLRMNYAYLLLIKTAWGENRKQEAYEVVRDSYELSPNHPLTYLMDSLTALYSGNLPVARSKAKEALAFNPQARLSQNVNTYVERQASQFPTITILKLDNL